MKKTKKKAESMEGKVISSSGNVFADLGFADPTVALLKSRLAQQIARLIKSHGYTQIEAAKEMGIDQPKVSMIMRGRLKDFSTDRLVTLVTKLNQDVIVTFAEPRDHERASVRVMVEA